MLQHRGVLVFGGDTFTGTPTQVLGVAVFLFIKAKELWNCVEPQNNKQSQTCIKLVQNSSEFCTEYKPKAVITGW